MSPLPSNERRALLELARKAIAAVVARGPAPEIPSHLAGLPSVPGVFVTLHHRGRLRGCIGRIDACEDLARTVARCAISAAVEDPRFAPLDPEELAGVKIEISVLGPFQEIRPDEIRVGQDGLLVTRGRRRGLLLPQVGQQFHWAAEKFLEETCLKAGLEREAWKDPATRIEAFTAEVFSETEVAGQGMAQTG